MAFLGYAYRFAANFLFLALVFFTLNLVEKYSQRASVAILVLVYCAMRAIATVRSFYFYQRIERLEVEARRLSNVFVEGPLASTSRRQVIGAVSELRRSGEMSSYIDLLFLALIVVLCVVKVVTN